MGTLTFENELQAALWELELSGQISDGMWENSGPRDHWEAWCRADVRVGTPAGRDFIVRKDNYGFTRTELLSVVGQRMITFARLTIALGDRNLVAKVQYLFEEDGSLRTNWHNSDWWLARKAEAERALEEFGTTTEALHRHISNQSFDMAALRATLRRMMAIIRTRSDHAQPGVPQFFGPTRRRRSTPSPRQPWTDIARGATAGLEPVSSELTPGFAQ